MPEQGARLRVRGRPLDQAANRDPVPITALGRFAHEAVAVDPRPGRVYLTEDASGPNGLLYRWTPPREAFPLRQRRRCARCRDDDAGTLEATPVPRRPRVPDLSVATEAGTTLRVEWVHGAGPRRHDASVPQAVRATTRSPAAASSRAVVGDGGACVVARFARLSDGSAAEHDGQVWFLRSGTDTLRARAALRGEPRPRGPGHRLDGPDNITVSPYGGLILAEDGEGVQHLVGATDAGVDVPARSQRRPRELGVHGPERSRPTGRSCSPTCRSRATSSRSGGRSANSTSYLPRINGGG